MSPCCRRTRSGARGGRPRRLRRRPWRTRTTRCCSSGRCLRTAGARSGGSFSPPPLRRRRRRTEGRRRKVTHHSSRLVDGRMAMAAVVIQYYAQCPDSQCSRAPVPGMLTFCGKLCTACGHRIAHRKWKETELQPGTAGPDNMLGSCLLSFLFLWAIHPIRHVQRSPFNRSSVSNTKLMNERIERQAESLYSAAF